MNKWLSSLVYILLLLIFLGGSYFYQPKEIKFLDQKEYGEVMGRGLPANIPALYFYWWSNQRKLSDLRVRQALTEIKNTPVAPGKIKIWSLLNMGTVIKTDKNIIAIDAANLPFSSAHNELAKIADIFLVTHQDGDHFGPGLLSRALEQNKKVAFLEGVWLESQPRENLIILTSGKTVEINGVKITAYQTDHRGDGNFKDGGAWLMVETGNFKLLHTGDGREFKNKAEREKVYNQKDIDILLANAADVHPYNIRDLRPKVAVPLHLYKFMSGKGLYEESTIESVSENYRQYAKDLAKIKTIFLLPGESFDYPLPVEPEAAKTGQ